VHSDDINPHTVNAHRIFALWMVQLDVRTGPNHNRSFLIPRNNTNRHR
jgi:hypothetical protein